MPADPLERVTNLLALLLETRVPLTLDDIASELAGQYPDGTTARRAAFERDKSLLRSEGVPIDSEVLGGDRAGATGYRIDRARYELDDLKLEDDERRALQVALAAVRFAGETGGLGGTDGVWTESALWKVSGDDPTAAGEAERDGDEREAAPAAGLAASLPAVQGLAPLYVAVSSRASVTFTYHGKPRTLDPWGLLAREGFWYVVGFEHGAGEQRTFRVDRIEGAVDVGESAVHERPADFDVRSAFPADAKRLGGADAVAQVWVGAARANVVIRELGDAAIRERRDDGSIVAEVPCANPVAFRSWLLGFMDQAEVLAPAEQRAEITHWLRSIGKSQ